jgi:hypothetical protein
MSDDVTAQFLPIQQMIQQWFSQHNEQFNKQFEPLTKLWNDSFTQLPTVLQAAVKQISERTIETNIEGEPAAKYSTNITNTGDILNKFPEKVPTTNDVYWTRHTQLVDRVLTDRQATIDKVIDTLGGTVKGIVNPISAMNPADIIKLIDSFKK